MKPFEFLDHISATAKNENPVPKNRLGYIDYDFDPSRFPQYLPRVMFDGQGLSHKGYSCVGDYLPEPGDRVVLLPVGTDFVILGALNKVHRPQIVPGTLAFHGLRLDAAQNISGGNLISWNSIPRDPFGFVEGAGSSPNVITPTIPGWYLVMAKISVSGTGISAGYLNSSFQVNGESFDTSRSYSGGVTLGYGLNTTLNFDGSTDNVSLWASYDNGVTSTAAAYRPYIKLFYLGLPYPDNLNPRFME